MNVWKPLDLCFVQSNAKYNVYIISKLGLNILRQIYGFPISLINLRHFHSTAVEVVLYIRSSRCSSESCNDSAASLWFPFSPCQGESTPISLLQTYRTSVLLPVFWGPARSFMGSCQILVWIRDMDWEKCVNSKCGLKVLCEFEMQIERYM